MLVFGLLGIAVCHSATQAQPPGAITSGQYAPALSQALQLSLPASERPVVVFPSFHLLAIHGIDDEAETIEFSGVLTVRWKDSAQAFDPEVDGVDLKLYSGDYQFNELAPAWYPQMVLVNAVVIDDSQGVLVRVEPDGTSTVIQTIHSSVRARLDLHSYPFDEQHFNLLFTVIGFDDTEVVLAVDDDAVVADLSRLQVPQWNLEGVDASIRTYPAPHAGAELSSSVFALSLNLSRKSFFMVRLVIMPLILIVVLSWAVFWMDRSSLGDRMGVSFVGILTAVAYQNMVSGVMPHISYVTFMNAFLNISFLVMVATVLINLIVGHYDRKGESVRGDMLDRRCRVVFPLSYTLLVLLAAFIEIA